MRILGKSGSSKTEWAVVDGNQVIDARETEGINPFFQTRREISRSIRLGLPKEFFRRKIEKIHFYCAGCSSEEKKEIVGASLIAQFRTPVEVESDLLAAARGLFVNEAGIACILGTGSNSCYYDGNKIAGNIKAAGYILGDEGSFASFGKSFLSDVLKGFAPEKLVNEFYTKYNIGPHDIMSNIYDLPFPHRFLVKTADFLADYPDDNYVNTLVMQNIRKFFIRNICRYDNYKSCSIRIMGSVATRYENILKEVSNEFGITIDKIVKSPMEGLIKYHSQQNSSK